MGRTVLRSVIALLVSGASVLAQTGSITGTVTAAEGGLPIFAAQVDLAGTSIVAVTRDDGRYTLVAPVGTYTVRVRRLGFQPDSMPNVVVTADAQATANFRLRSAATMLEQMVVTGYGEQEARDRTGVIDKVTSDEFNTGRVVNPEELIQGKVAGLQVIDNAEPGGGTSIRIRGGTSVTSSNEPLIVIDGIPIAIGGGISSGRNPLAFLNPNDIESMTVLKDASATAIYGSRGANGVIMVTTRSGATSPQFSYTTSMSASTITREPDMLSAEQYRAVMADREPGNVGALGTANTNWRDLVQRSGSGREHQFAFGGSGTDMSYRLSLGYLDQEGVIVGSDLKRVSAGLNYSDLLFRDQLAIRTVIMGTRTDDAFAPGGVIGAATSFAPTQPVRNEDGSFFQWTEPLGANNPVEELSVASERATNYRSVGKLEGEYHLPFLQGLSVTSRVGYDVGKSDRTDFYPSTMQWQVETGSLGTIRRNSPTLVSTLFDLFGTYDMALPNFQSHLDATLGYSYEESRGDYPSFYAEGLSSNLLGPSGIPGATRERTFLSIDESKLASFFGRVNYSLLDRYLVTLSVRRDGSSRFGPEQQWGTFPSAAFAWRIAEEGFGQSLGPLSDLKLRLSWGKNGNQAFGNYRAYSSYQIGGSTAQTQFGNEFVTTIRPGAADPGIKWEETTSYNLGVDYGFLANRLTGAIDYYVKKTEDLIFNVPVAAGTNLSNFVTTNIGNMENRGLELSLNAMVLDGQRYGLQWNTSLNASTNRNELTQINAVGAGDEQIPVGGISGGVGSTIQVLQPGFPVNSFFVYRHRRNADGTPVYADTDGDGSIDDDDLYEDLNADGSITQSDRAPYKSPAPKWIIGHSSSMTFRNFDFGYSLRAYRGNYVYNNVASNLGHYSLLRGGAPANLHSSVLRNQFVNPQYFSDVYVEDASFIRMDNISFGYTIRELRNVRQLRVFGVVQNAFTITDYSGVDPTAGVNGIDNNLYPRARTLTAGMTVAF